jgi:hypothetical protein
LPRKSKSKSSGPDWTAVARDYAAGTLMVTEICALHGISWDAFYRRRSRDNWPARRIQTKRSGRSELAQRLLAALDQKMTEFETRLTDGAAPSAADSERDARTLNTLVRLFDKLQNFDAKAAPPKPSSAAASTAHAAHSETSHDADRLRHDLAQRLEKLRAGLSG